MSYEVVLEHCPDGSYLARCRDVQDAYATGEDPDRILEDLKQQILYQVEYCPCSYVEAERMELDVTEVEVEECRV